MTTYLVNVYDCAGEFDSTACEDFMGACNTYVQRRNEYPGKVVLVFNRDRCDVDTDGLTEEEVDALDADRDPPFSAEDELDR